MVRKAWLEDRIYMDEAEGFLLEHALFSPPRTWPPLAPAQNQHAESSSSRLTAGKKKMDWDDEVRLHPDEPVDVPVAADEPKGDGDHKYPEDSNKERCVICLMALRDRTIVGVCGHEFCFECIGVWANQSRRCPLCSADMAPFLLHDLDAITPIKFYLPPLPQRKLPSATLPLGQNRRPYEDPRWGRREKLEMDELDHQVERRREIYQHELYVKHIASNMNTRFRPNPTPREIHDSPLLVTRATTFMRRELRVWQLVDVEFLTTYILSLLKAIDIRSDPAIRLLAEFLDTDDSPYPRAAEHFAHELYSFLRSPYKELRRYDEVAQYDPIPSPSEDARSQIATVSRHSSQAPEAQALSPAVSARSPSPGGSSYRSRSRSISRSHSPYSRSSYSPSPPRDTTRRDTFIPTPPASARKWNEADTWLDPEYAAWLEEEKRRADERIAARRERARRSTLDAGTERQMRSWDKPVELVELLPSPPPQDVKSTGALHMDTDVHPPTPPATEADSPSHVVHIKGAAGQRRLTLLERLAKAKAEAAGSAPPPLIPSATSNDPVPSASARQEREAGLKAMVRARLKLRSKLATERATYTYKVNESRAYALRAKLLEARARRESEETDATLRKLDKIEKAKEVRRRLMVLKMLAAETDAERRARELKARLLERKKSAGRRAGEEGLGADLAVSVSA